MITSWNQECGNRAYSNLWLQRLWLNVSELEHEKVYESIWSISHLETKRVANTLQRRTRRRRNWNSYTSVYTNECFADFKRLASLKQEVQYLRLCRCLEYLLILIPLSNDHNAITKNRTVFPPKALLNSVSYWELLAYRTLNKGEWNEIGDSTQFNSKGMKSRRS